MALRQLLIASSAVIVGVNVTSAALAQAVPELPASGSAEPPVALEEITVTAERQTTSAQKAALSISTISGDKLAATGISNYADAVQNVPGLQFQSGQQGSTPSQPVFAIRGLGQDGLQAQPSVTTFLDDVVEGGVGAIFYDVSRVEVLRGPQGTLYGGNAPAGSVNIFTNDPVIGKLGGYAQFDGGSYNLYHAEAALNVPVNDVLALRIAGNVISRDNYADSSVSGQREVSIRAKLLFQPSPNVSILLGTEQYQYKGLGVDAYAIQTTSGDLTGVYAPLLGYGRIHASKYWGTLNWKLGSVNLTYISAYQRFDNYQNTGIYDPPTVVATGGSNNIRDEPYHNLLTQEVRLSSAADAKLSYVAGLYFSKFDNYFDALVGDSSPFPPVVPSVEIQKPTNNKNYAAFAQATYSVTPALRVTGGIRYSVDDITTTSSITLLFLPAPIRPPATVTAFAETFHNVAYLGRVEYELAPRNIIYALTSTGYRPGGLGQGGTNFNSEHATSYEIGSKNRFFGGRLQINGDVYYTNYPSYQNEADTPSGDMSPLPISNIISIPARFIGTEIEATALLTPNDQFNVSLAYERAKYTADAIITGAVVPTNGQALPHAPVWNVSGGYDHTFSFPRGDKLIASVDGRYVSSQGLYFSSCLYDASLCSTATYPGAGPGQLRQGGYGLIDASLVYHFPNDMYTVTLYVRNLGDEVYKTGYSFSFGGAGLGAPRTYGIIARAKF